MNETHHAYNVKGRQCFWLILEVVYYFADIAPAKTNHVIRDLGMEDEQLSKMLHTLMGEAKQIRGDDSRKSSSASVS